MSEKAQCLCNVAFSLCRIHYQCDPLQLGEPDKIDKQDNIKTVISENARLLVELANLNKQLTDAKKVITECAKWGSPGAINYLTKYEGK